MNSNLAIRTCRESIICFLALVLLSACTVPNSDEHTGSVESAFTTGYVSRFKLMNSAGSTALDLWYTTDGATNWYKVGATQSLGISNVQHNVTAPTAATYDGNQVVHIAYVSSSHAVEVVYSGNLAGSWGHFTLGVPSGYLAYGKPGLVSYTNLDSSKHLEIYVPFYCGNASLCQRTGPDVLYRRVFNGALWGDWQMVTTLPDGFGNVTGQWSGVPTILASPQIANGRTDIAFANGNGILTKSMVHMFSVDGGSSWSQELWTLPSYNYMSTIGTHRYYAPAFQGAFDFFYYDETGDVIDVHYDGSTLSSTQYGLPAGAPCDGSVGLGSNAFRGAVDGFAWMGCRPRNSSNNSAATIYTTYFEAWTGVGPSDLAGYWNQSEGTIIWWGAP